MVLMESPEVHNPAALPGSRDSSVTIPLPPGYMEDIRRAYEAGNQRNHRMLQSQYLDLDTPPESEESSVE